MQLECSFAVRNRRRFYDFRELAVANGTTQKVEVLLLPSTAEFGDPNYRIEKLMFFLTEPLE